MLSITENQHCAEAANLPSFQMSLKIIRHIITITGRKIINESEITQVQRNMGRENVFSKDSLI